MITFELKSSGRTEKYLDKLKKMDFMKRVESLASRGTAALSAATPRRTGATAASWSHSVKVTGDRTTITWSNSHINHGVNIAVILQYGHGTGTGGWVQGQDYINPAIKPVMDSIAESVWKEATSL